MAHLIAGRALTLQPGHVLNSVTATSQLVATVTKADGSPLGGAKLSLSVTAGPDAPVSLPGVTDAHGQATFSLVNNGVPGADTATAVLSGVPGSVPSNPATIDWQAPTDTGRAIGLSLRGGVLGDHLLADTGPVSTDKASATQHLPAAATAPRW